MMAKERMTKICLTFTPMNEGKNLPQKSMNSLLEIYQVAVFREVLDQILPQYSSYGISRNYEDEIAQLENNIVLSFVHNFMKPEFKNSQYWIEINSNEIFYFSAIAKLNSTNLERIGAWIQMTRTLHSICSSIRCILIPFLPLCIL